MAEPETAADIIARIGLQSHPEGGHYREIFRDARTDPIVGRTVAPGFEFSGLELGLA